MNRKKKINQTLKSRLKRSNAKLNPSNKPKYISKAERAKLALAEENENNNAEIVSDVVEDEAITDKK